jgi:hypothetical protein
VVVSAMVVLAAMVDRGVMMVADAVDAAVWRHRDCGQ